MNNARIVCGWTMRALCFLTIRCLSVPIAAIIADRFALWTIERACLISNHLLSWLAFGACFVSICLYLSCVSLKSNALSVIL